jgi:PAS domain S-box-containing protein
LPLSLVDADPIMSAPPTLTALVQNEIFYPALIESLPVAIYTCDEQGYITHYNAAAAELWGRRPEKGVEQYTGAWKVIQLNGSPLPKDQDPMAISIKQKRELNGQEIIIERPDGTRRFIQTNPRPITDTSGNFAGAVNLLIDITTTKVIHQERERLSAIIQGSEDAIISKTLDGIITSWNPSAEKLFGYTESEMIGQTIMKLIPLELSDEEPVIIERLKRGERVEHFETKRVSKTGELLDISLTISPVRNNEGIIVGASKIARNITTQKKAEQILKDSVELFQTMADNVPAMIWMSGKDKSNDYFNKAWLAFSGRTEEQESSEGWLQGVHPDDKLKCIEIYKNALRDRKGFYSEYRLRRYDGQYRWIADNCVPRLSPSGEFAGFISACIDIDDQKRLEQRKDDFIKMASHELKTPITSIKGYVQLLLVIYEEMNDEKLSASKGTVKSSLSTVSKQITKLTRLISDLLDMSRIETGKLDLNYSEFDPVLLVEETVQDIRHTSSRHNIIIHNEFEGTLEADRDRIAQVLINLLTNAIKYSPSSDTIDVFIRGDNNSIAFSVADYGIGINKTEQVRIFERFYRVEGKNELTYPGFGIGLFIASEIVQRHQGTIQVKSEKDKGSVFTFKLPLITKQNVNE